MLGIKEGLSLYNEYISTEAVSLLLHRQKPSSSSVLTPPVHVWGLPLQHNSMECEYLRNKNAFLDLLAELWGITCDAPSWAGRGSFHSLCKNHGVGMLAGTVGLPEAKLTVREGCPEGWSLCPRAVTETTSAQSLGGVSLWFHHLIFSDWWENFFYE